MSKYKGPYSGEALVTNNAAPIGEGEASKVLINVPLNDQQGNPINVEIEIGDGTRQRFRMIPNNWPVWIPCESLDAVYARTPVNGQSVTITYLYYIEEEKPCGCK